jgi:hypothetical protein
MSSEATAVPLPEGDVGASMARAGTEHVGRRLGAGDGRSPGIEAEVIEDALRRGRLGDEGDELKPTAAGTG